MATNTPLQVVAAVILNAHGDILCLRRHPNQKNPYAGLYEFPGGKVEPNESNEDAISREIMEELHIDITPAKTLTTIHHPLDSGITIALTALLCTQDSGEIVLAEHTDPLWLPVDQLSSLKWAPADLEIVHRLQQDYVHGQLADYGLSQKFTLQILGETDSTNRALIDDAEQGAPAGTIILADYQSTGRGRLDRTWVTPRGENLLFSLLVRPTLPIEEIVTLPLLAGLAMTLALRNEVLWPNRQQPGIKWPNDILLGDKKLCGILCQSQTSATGIEGIIIGIGVNTSYTPPELAHRATDIKTITGQPCDKFKLLAFFCLTFDKLYTMWARGGFQSICKQVNDCDIKIDQPITVKEATRTLSGICKGIDKDGSLILLRDDGIIDHIICGEIHQWEDL